MKVSVIITAAGKGSRFSGSHSSRKELPKQFTKLKGKPVILYSLNAFQKTRLVDEIFVSSNPEYFDFIHSLAVKHKISKLTTLVEGGKTRFESIRNTFMQIEGKPNDIVLIHDAVRPNIERSFVESLIKYAGKFGSAVPGLSISETVKKEKNGFVVETINRSNLWTIQTPQAFKYKVLKKAYRKAGRKKDFTDEAALVENAGFKVRIVDGHRGNVKITTSEDIKFLKKIM
jgi:2-C-methyl-D-erythritol 4-phosphate cytidylyltransferase